MSLLIVAANRNVLSSGRINKRQGQPDEFERVVQRPTWRERVANAFNRSDSEERKAVDKMIHQYYLEIENAVRSGKTDLECPALNELEKIAGTNPNPILRKMAREAILHIEAHQRILDACEYSDTRRYSAAVFGIAARQDALDQGQYVNSFYSWRSQTSGRWEKFERKIEGFIANSQHADAAAALFQAYLELYKTVYIWKSESNRWDDYANEEKWIRKLFERHPDIELARVFLNLAKNRCTHNTDNDYGRANAQATFLLDTVKDGLLRTNEGTHVFGRIAARMGRINMAAKRRCYSSPYGNCYGGSSGDHYAMDDGRFSEPQGGWGGGD
ncbi:MAG: hypothetical protein WCT31_05250 [Candidatus Micrarchaeia archaeon]